MIALLVLTVVTCLCAPSHSMPTGADPVPVVLDYQTDSHSRFESGIPGERVSGHYTWDDGERLYRVEYTADEKGFRPRMFVNSKASPGAQKPSSDTQQALEPDQPAITSPDAPPPAPIGDVTAAEEDSVNVAAQQDSDDKPVLVSGFRPPTNIELITDDAVIIEAADGDEPAPNIEVAIQDYIHQLFEYEQQLQAQYFQEHYNQRQAQERAKHAVEDGESYSSLDREDETEPANSDHELPVHQHHPSLDDFYRQSFAYQHYPYGLYHPYLAAEWPLYYPPYLFADPE